MLAWNKAAEEIFTFGRMAEEDRNTLISMLTKPAWNHLEVRTLRGVLSALEREPREE